MMFDEKFDYGTYVKPGIKSKIFVYFLLQDEDVVYVGQTTSGIIRPISHLNDKVFNFIKIIYCERENLGKMEHKYILKYNPLYNKTKNICNRSDLIEFKEENQSIRFAKFRAMHKLTQQELADKLNISRELVNKIENVKIEPSKIVLAKMDLLERGE